jgi:hypothetical protein
MFPSVASTQFSIKTEDINYFINQVAQGMSVLQIWVALQIREAKENTLKRSQNHE